MQLLTFLSSCTELEAFNIGFFFLNSLSFIKIKKIKDLIEELKQNGEKYAWLKIYNSSDKLETKLKSIKNKI